MGDPMFFVQSCSICTNRGVHPRNIFKRMVNLLFIIGTWCCIQKKDVKPYFCCRDFVLDANKL